MPESMGIDMWEIVPPAELGQPVCYAVRVYWLSVILSKQKALFSVILTQPQPLRVLPCPVLPKELHRFRWQRNPTIRSRGFWRILIYAYTVMQYAQNAYQTAGMSANEYMTTVTAFSASLLQSMDNDTDAAAQRRKCSAF